MNDVKIITPAKYKTNTDYLNEISLKRRIDRSIYDNFNTFLTSFNSLWYGELQIDEQLFQELLSLKTSIIEKVENAEL
jgi:hypothetical protein